MLCKEIVKNLSNAFQFFQNWKVFVLVGTLMSLAGCSPKVITQEVPVKVEHTVQSERIKVIHDTLMNHTHDSVVVYNLGDTIIEKHYNNNFYYNSRGSHDTIRVNDTIQMPVPINRTVTKEVEKDLNWFEKLQMGIGVAVLVIAGIGLIVDLIMAWKKSK